MRFASLAAIALILSSNSAPALEPLEGYFVAKQSCELFQSKNKGTNPGDLMTRDHHAYAMIAINKTGGDFFQVRVPDAPVTLDRWVHVSCGVHVIEASTQVAAPSGPAVVTPVDAPESMDNLLALSWQPAFCEGKPNKVECQALNAGQLPITQTQLSIHGLWPQPRGNDYCGVPSSLVAADKARNWDQLPAVEIDAETREALDVAMPGTASLLERHEWIKHGTCYHGAGGADEYYDDTLILTEAINGSAVGQFLEDHVGAEIETADIRALFDAEFGAGAGDRVQFHCKGDNGRVLLQELMINLKGQIAPNVGLSTLLLAADSTSLGCPRGVIDPTGLQ